MACILVAVALMACSRGETTPKNVILIVIDTVGARHLGSYGHERPTSPNLDAFAAESVLFENAVAVAPWTLPSHASLLTGLYPSRNGVRTREHTLAPDVPTLAGLLGEQGFETAAFVNAIFLAPSFGLGRGFDTYELVPPDDSREGAASEVSKRGLAWLEEHREARCFLFLNYFDAHSDYRSMPRFEQMMGVRRGRVDGTTAQLVEVKNGTLSFSPSDGEELERLYDAGVRQLDANLGTLFSRLEEGGWFRDSLVIVTSDHGEELLEHGSVLHTHAHYDELLSVPLLLRGPSLPQGVRFETQVSLVDVAPTIVSVLGLPPSAPTDGIDLRALWEAPQRPPGGTSSPPGRRRWVFAETGPNHSADQLRSVQDDRYKLILNLETNRRELYDRAVDPGEKNDIWSLQSEIAKELGAALEQHMQSEREAVQAPPLSPEMKERLRQLGYL